MKIHQILINDENKIPKELPDTYHMCYEQLKKIYPDDDIHLYSGDELEEIIKKNFSIDVYTSYKKLKPYAFKSDLARQCLLYLYGGLYIDLNIFLVKKIPNLEDLDFFAFRDYSKSSQWTWAVHNSIIFSKKNSFINKLSIDFIVDNCKTSRYWKNCIDITGPTILGRSLVFSLNSNISTKGELRFFEKDLLDEEIRFTLDLMGYKSKFVSGFFMDEKSSLIAIKKHSFPGDISSLGYLGTNNYISMYENYEVYDETVKFGKKYKYIHF